MAAGRLLQAPAPADLGENHDRYLAEIWGREKGE